MALSISPDIGLVFKDPSESEVVNVTLTNTESHSPVWYKVRIAKSFTKIFQVTNPRGRIDPRHSQILSVKYNPPGLGDASMQVKFIKIAEGMPDNETVFETHKTDVETKVVPLTFEDLSLDFNYVSPKVSEVYRHEDTTEREARANWWSKQGTKSLPEQH